MMIDVYSPFFAFGAYTHITIDKARSLLWLFLSFIYKYQRPKTTGWKMRMRIGVFGMERSRLVYSIVLLLFSAIVGFKIISHLDSSLQSERFLSHFNAHYLSTEKKPRTENYFLSSGQRRHLRKAEGVAVHEVLFDNQTLEVR